MWLWSEHLWIWVLMECHHRRGSLNPRFVNIRKYFCVNYLINVAGQVRNLLLQREWTSAEDDDLRNLRIHGQARLQEENAVWGGETVPTCSGERYFLCVRFSLQRHKYLFTINFFRIFSNIIPKDWVRFRAALKVFQGGTRDESSCGGYDCKISRPTIVEKL